MMNMMNGMKKTAVWMLAALLTVCAASGCSLRESGGTGVAREAAGADETKAAEEANEAGEANDAETEAGKTFAELFAAYEENKGRESDGSPAAADSLTDAAADADREDGNTVPAVSAENAADDAVPALSVPDAVPVSGGGASASASYTLYANGLTKDDELFTERDLLQTADLSGAKALTVSDGSVLAIAEEGVYVLSGTASGCTVKVEADKEAKVQLVLNGVSVTNENFPVIYVVSADKVFVTTAAGSENALTVTGAFVSDGETGTNTDAVIYSKDDLVLNGLGSLRVVSYKGNGITSKDDLKITGGVLSIASALDALEANDSIAACAGVAEIASDKDGLHCENDEALGFVWIGGGTWNISAKSDGIQGTAYVQIDGGDLTVAGSEGIEATYVQINGGTVVITASDDGINASRKSGAYSVTIEINGGELDVTVGQGDTDALDANGSIYVNGGVVRITSTVSSFDYDEIAEFNGGTIIINGEEVDGIPASMFGGPGGFGGGPGGWGGGWGRGPGGRG